MLQFATSSLFDIIQLLLYIITVFIVVAVIQNNKPIWLIYGLGSFTFARMFRVASFEIDNIKDRQYLIAIFLQLLLFLL